MVDTTDISKKLTDAGRLEEIFNAIDTNDHGNSVLHVLKIMEELNIIPKIERPIKSKEKSDLFREEGTKQFKNKKYDLALQYLNLALLNAPPKSKTMQLAYASRSGFFFYIKRYKACINDIDTALGMNFPRDTDPGPKLIKRKDVCIARQEKDPKVKCFIETACAKFKKISNPVSDIPCCSDAVKLEMNGPKRVIVADRTINVGDIIAVEAPYMSQPIRENLQLCCYSCLKYSENLMPCMYCCEVMFCSPDCREASRREGHDIECQLMNLCMSFSDHFHFNFKIVLKAYRECSNWEDIMMRVQRANEVTDVRRGFVENVVKRTVLDSQFYESICTQRPMEGVWRHGTLFNLTVRSAVIVHILSNLLMLTYPRRRVDILKFLGEQLIHHAVYGVTRWISASIYPPFVDDPDEVKCTIPNKGLGCYAFTGLLEHSCNPNVECFGFDNKLVLIATKTMTAGCELKISYGVTFLQHTLQMRQFKLYKNFSLQCTCEACENDWGNHDCLDHSVTKEQVNMITKFTFDRTYKIHSIGEAVDNLDLICKAMATFQDKPTSQYYNAYYRLFKECVARFQDHVAPQHVRGTILHTEAGAAEAAVPVGEVAAASSAADQVADLNLNN